VNGWPRFTAHYPKEWVEVRPYPWEPFRAAVPGPAREPTFAVGMGPLPQPLEKFVDSVVQRWSLMAQDVTVVSNKPSKLRDGTPALEFELRMVLNGAPHNFFSLATKRGDFLVAVVIESSDAKTGENLKAMAYSLEFQPGHDEPVKLPPDIQAFLDQDRNDVVSHDLEKIMSHYSDKYLNSGTTKEQWEQYLRQTINPVTSFELVITDFVPAGDRAYLAGFVQTNFGKDWLRETSIIKENGEWKWYGNQRDAPPQ